MSIRRLGTSRLEMFKPHREIEETIKDLKKKPWYKDWRWLIGLVVGLAGIVLTLITLL